MLKHTGVLYLDEQRYFPSTGEDLFQFENYCEEQLCVRTFQVKKNDTYVSTTGAQKQAQGTMTEKVKNRLEQLDDFEEVIHHQTREKCTSEIRKKFVRKEICF